MFSWTSAVLSKVLAGLLIVAMAVTPFAYFKGRSDGKALAEGRYAAAGLGVLRQAIDRVAKVGGEIAEIGKALAADLEASARDESASIRTVTKVIRENPDFAGVRRPDELERLRRQQLEAVGLATGSDRL